MQHLDEGTIHAWLDGALAVGEARQAEAHVAGCATCAEAVAEARGLIAASSMIVAKLDGVPGAGESRAAAGGPVPDDIAAARAAVDARQRPARRPWFAAPGFRAAAAVLVLAGGVAAIQNATGRDELARVVSDAPQGETAPMAADIVSQDATAASTEQAAAAPPPPTVGPAPALPRPAQVVGGVTPIRRPAPQPMVGDVSGVLAGVEAAARRDEVTPTAAPSVNTGGMVAAATAGRASSAEGQRAELPQERDLATSAKAAAAAPAPVAPAAGSPPAAAFAAETSRTPALADGAGLARRELRPLADSILAQQEVRRQAEESAAPQQRFTPPVAARGRAAPSAIAAAAEPAEGAARCYLLTLSPWSPEQGAIPGAPATRVVLSADTGTVGPSRGQRLVRPMPGAFAGSYEHAWYTEVGPSTLVLTWATGTEGIVMRLVRSGDALAGTARTFGAAGSVERTSTVRGERVDCGGAR